MKNIISLMVTLFIGYLVKADKDIIYKTDRTEITCKVIEITEHNTVKYKDADNPDGPIMNISAEKVFMIEYSNGKKWKPEINSDTKFGDSRLSGNPIDVNLSPSRTTGLTSASIADMPIDDNINDIHGSPIKDYWATKSMVYQKTNVAEANKPITFLGLDFSFMKYVDPREIGNSNKLKYIDMPALVDKIYNSILPSHNREFVGTLSADYSYFRESIKRIDDNIVSAYDYNIDIKKIPAIINSYPLSQKDGIAQVFIMEKMVKNEKMFYGYWVCFNVTNRSIIYIVRHKQECGTIYGLGYSWKQLWGDMFDQMFLGTNPLAQQPQNK